MVVDGVRFVSRALRRNLDAVERVFPYIATCGTEADAIAVPPDDLVQAIWLWTLKEAVLRAAREHLFQHLSTRYRIAHYATMDPGSGDAEVWPLELVPARGAAPADRWRYLDDDFAPGGGTVGVIPTVTKPFCGDCDRVRLTADGQFRTCLFATDEFDLRDALRAGETDDELAVRIERAVGTKWAGHQINQVNFVRPARTMSQIGG